MLKIENLNKTYTNGKLVTKAIDNMSVEFRKSEFVAILGPSGCGKTTLLNMLGALDTPDSGSVSLNGNNLNHFKDIKLDKYRNSSIGYIFQTHNLIDHLSIVENVEMGMVLGGISKKERRKKALKILDDVGLTNHLHKKIKQLSVGQSQRVAIARALVNNPDIILADEPTGSVDSKTAIEILDLIKKFGEGKLVIMVTHNPGLLENYATRVIKLNDGKIISDSNPYVPEENTFSIYRIKKNFMSFLTSLKMSFKNIRTKPGRSILMVLATSIGLIGIALILALSGGIKQEIIKLQTRIIGNYPINIAYNSYQQEKLVYIEEYRIDGAPNLDGIIPVETRYAITEDPSKFNHITDDFVDYINDYKELNPSKIVGLTIKPKMIFSVYYKSINDLGKPVTHRTFHDDGSATAINKQTQRYATLLPSGEIFDEIFEYVAGDEPHTINDPSNKTFGVVLLVDEHEKLSGWTLSAIGYNAEEAHNIDPLSFLGYEFFMCPGSTYVKTLDPENTITLKVSGIVKYKEDSQYHVFSHGIGYTSDLVDFLNEKYPESIAKNDYDYVLIYGKDFKAKNEIAKHIDLYNESLPSESRKIEYFDRSVFYVKNIEGIINLILIGLIAFSSISLGVASIMIATITFTSVVERTKEIGVLRALGARKIDIFRVFSGENFIIGVAAGLLAIIISHALTIPINILARNYYGITKIAHVNLFYSILLIFISLFWTISAGILPSKMATNKNPVESLRVE